MFWLMVEPQELVKKRQQTPKPCVNLDITFRGVWGSHLSTGAITVPPGHVTVCIGETLTHRVTCTT